MKVFLALLFLLSSFTFAFTQNEQSPIVRKEIAYKNWSYKNVRGGEAANLRALSQGKTLVMVVYFAPWCPNWKHDAAFVQGLYEKYKGNGFQVIGVGEYDPVDAMKTHLDAYKITFPTVYESELRTDMQKTSHYEYRKSTGDSRKWGSPWYVFLDPAFFEKTGEVVTKNAFVVNGELIKEQTENFIRMKLRLPPIAGKNPTLSPSNTEIIKPSTNPTRP